MTKALDKRISKAYYTIYDAGDSGLDYMDRHIALDTALMEHLYNDTITTLSVADKTRMANMLEKIVADMQFDLC